MEYYRIILTFSLNVENSRCGVLLVPINIVMDLNNVNMIQLIKKHVCLALPYTFHASRPHRCPIQKHYKNDVIVPTGAILPDGYKHYECHFKVYHHSRAYNHTIV